MTFPKLIGLCATLVALCTISCNNDEKTEAKKPGLKEESITYAADGITMNGYVVYDSSTNDKRPVVLVVHEWWGQNDYPRMRAKQLAELGYLAMAVDMYGNGKTVETPDSANALATPFYNDPQMAKRRFDAALEKIKTYPQAGDKIAAIGYCFGGSMVLNMAKLGDDLDGVVSFHGVLSGNPPADKNLLKAKILVCHGGADPFTPQKDINEFKKQLDSINADYTFKVYPGATHAFTNPGATEAGKKFNLPIAYNATADSASWKDMRTFFETIFK